MTALIFVGIAILIGLGIWYSWYAKKKRREELAVAARQLGLEYSAEDTLGCLGLPFDLLKKGDGRGTENVLWGAWQGMDLREFDYWYYEESTDSQGHRSKTYYHFSCAATELPLQGAHLTIGKENVFTRLADHLGFQDIEFELEAFNRAFQVKCKDRKFATDVIDQRMMQWLMEHGAGYGIEMNGPWLLVSCKRVRPTELTPLLGTMQQYVRHVPTVAYSLYGTGQSQDAAAPPPPAQAPQPPAQPGTFTA
jgi:hypothetical protein